MDKTTADELLYELVHHGSTIVGKDNESTMRMVIHGPWTLIITTVNTISLFEKGLSVYTIQINDMDQDIAKIIVRAYDHDESHGDFEYL